MTHNRLVICNLSWLASRAGVVTDTQIEQITKWLDDDWESHDVEQDAVRLIRRLVDSLRDAYAADRERNARLDDADDRRVHPKVILKI